MGQEISACICTPFSANTDDDNAQYTTTNSNTSTHSQKEINLHQLETEIINNMLTEKPLNALNLCQDTGLPIVVQIENLSITPLDEYNESYAYICVQIGEQQRFVKPTDQKSDSTNQNVLFMVPFTSIDAMDTIVIIFKLFNPSPEPVIVSYMSNNTEVLMDIDFHKSRDNYLSTNNVSATKLYEQSMTQLAGVDTVIQSPIINLFESKTFPDSPSNMPMEAEKSVVLSIEKTEPVPLVPLEAMGRIPTDLAAVKTYCEEGEGEALTQHNTERENNQSNIISETNCVAECKLEIELKNEPNDFALYYKESQTIKLRYTKDNNMLNAAEITCKIFLNVLETYQQ